MKRFAGALFVSLIAAMATIVPHAQENLDRAFKNAMNTEIVDGNLTAAIEEYRRIVTQAVTNRELAAQALLRMAECHQKLGDREAQAIYERLVREYGDQSEVAATARARLAGTRTTTAVAIGDRPVWTGPKVDLFGQVSPDGRHITYVDWGGGQNLMVRDVVTNTDRPLTTTGPAVGFSQFAQFSTISRDGKQVAYSWFNERGQYDLRVVPLMGSGIPTPRVIFPGRAEFSIDPSDWSPDARSIAVTTELKDNTVQIGIVSVADGSLRVLKSFDWDAVGKVVFSPDGRFLAYDARVGDSNTLRTIFVMNVDGDSVREVAPHSSQNVVMAWAPDGTLLFSSDRSGELALWAQRIVDGRPAGTARLARRGIGSYRSLGMTTDGLLHVFRPGTGNYVQVASLDPSGASAATIQGFPRFVGSGGRPDWSRDGRYLAYSSCQMVLRNACSMSIVTAETGEVSTIRPKLAYLGVPEWSLDGRSFLTDGTDFKGRRALYRIDAATGDVTFVHERPGAIVQWSPDEKRIYYRRGGSIVERELASGVERVLFHEKAKGNGVSIKVSPDGRWIAAVETTGAGEGSLLLIPIQGGPVKELISRNAAQGFDGFRLEWMPDSQSLIVPQPRPRLALWRVAIESGKAWTIDLQVTDSVLSGAGYAIHPDGRRLAYVATAGQAGAEVWAVPAELKPGS